MAMGKCSAYSSLQADSKVKFAAWPMNWRPPGADRLCPEEPKWTLADGWRYRWQHYKYRCGCYYYYYYYYLKWLRNGCSMVLCSPLVFLPLRRGPLKSSLAWGSL